MDNHTYIRLINKAYPLPSGFIPANLVDSGIPFDAPANDEKRLLEARAAQAALSLFRAARQEGLNLYGVFTVLSCGIRKTKNISRNFLTNPGIFAM